MKNTMAMKLICMLLCVVMLGAMLAGCASGKQETAQTQPAAADPAATSTPAAETDAPATEESPLTGTISIMSTKDSWYPGFDDVCEQIEKNYGIAVDLTLVDDSSMGEILGVKFSTGDAPDIFLQNAPQVVEQYDAPNNCVVLDNEPWVSRCTDADYLRYKGDGHIYAMPVYQPSSFFGGVYYNKEVMADCGITDPNPQTYQEFLDICQTVKDHGYTPIWMTDQDSWTTQVWTTVGWGVALDAKKDTIYDDLNTNKVDFQDVPEMVDVLQKLQDLYTAGYCNADHLSSPYASGQVAIGEKKAAMVIQGEWFVSACQAAYPDVQLGSFAIPFIDGADNKIAIGVTPVPHAEIVNDVVVPKLEAAGWDVEVVEFNDYVQPNTSLEDGEIDANYFQTIRYLEEQNKERGLHLVEVAGIHLEPMGIYSKNYKSLEELPDGATIAVPNDGSNESRAIKLLADNGLITLAETEDLYNLTSIAENPHNFEITELDAANLPRSLDDVDAAVINGNYALEANLNPEKDALAAELADSDESYKYINYLVVKEGNEESTKTKALIAALQNDDVKKYIEEKYSGSVIPAF
mgnify:CR=1 FL=1